MQYETESGIIVNDYRHHRADDPRNWDPNENVDPPPPDGPGVGPNTSEGFGNDHVMYPDEETTPSTMMTATASSAVPNVQAWSGWPVEWNTPNWGGSVGLPDILGRVSCVYAATDLNSSILADMPPYRLQGDKVAPSLPWMNNPQPEVYTGWKEFMKQCVLSYYGGDVFLWATGRYFDGTVKSFLMLDPSWVTTTMLGHIRTYQMGGIDITEDVLHIRYNSWPGRKNGIGPLEALASNIFGVQALERYQMQLATRGGIPWGVLTAPGNLKADQAQRLRDNFVNARMSAMGAPATLSGGVTLTPFTISPKDMALLELRMFDEARIAVLLGVPPMLLGLPSGDSMTYKNAEGIYDFHWRAFLRPKASAIMEAISYWALPRGQCIELNRDDYVRPDFNDRVTGYQALFSIVDPITGQRAMTIDEIRRAERLNVLDDDGQTYEPIPPPQPLAITAGQDQGAQAES